MIPHQKLGLCPHKGRCFQCHHESEVKWMLTEETPHGRPRQCQACSWCHLNVCCLTMQKVHLPFESVIAVYVQQVAQLLLSCSSWKLWLSCTCSRSRSFFCYIVRGNVIDMYMQQVIQLLLSRSSWKLWLPCTCSRSGSFFCHVVHGNCDWHIHAAGHAASSVT